MRIQANLTLKNITKPIRFNAIPNYDKKHSLQNLKSIEEHGM